MGPIWGRQDPSVPHFGPMNFAIWEYMGVISAALIMLLVHKSIYYDQKQFPQSQVWSIGFSSTEIPGTFFKSNIWACTNHTWYMIHTWYV